MKKLTIVFISVNALMLQLETSGQTVDQIPKYATSTTLTNSVISEKSGNIGIDMPAPGFKLDVSGTLRSTLDANIHGITVGQGANGLSTSTAVGYNSLANTTLGYNTAVGYNTLGNSTGQQNTAVGYNSLSAVSAGILNTAVGFRTMQDYTSGGSVALGGFAMYHWVSGNYNTAMGYDALRGTGTGTGNIGIGRAALGASLSGSYNTAMGYTSLIGLTGGSYNIALGYASGANLTTGSNNILIGQSISASSATVSNELNIGNWIYGTGGNIGIGGANSTSAKLQITHGTAGNSGLRFANLTSASTAAASSGKVLSVNSTGDVVLETAGSGSGSYWAVSSINPNVIENTNTGAVYIGPSSTVTSLTGTYKLYVTDGIVTEKLKVKLKAANWPDYVFAKDYQLTGLPEVEHFIKQHGHLPGVISAAEVKADGFEVGETSAQLLKKIEELTLYLIQANKEIKDLQKKVTTLETIN